MILAPAALAQTQPTRPQPLGMTDPVPAARDIAFQGTMRIEVDATDTARGIFRVRQVIPVGKAGPMTLLYPKWLPGNHAPRGPIASIAGLKVKAAGKAVAWRRDPVDVYAFHIDVPSGAREIEVEFQHLSPTKSDQGRVIMTPVMLNLQWEKMSLYPAGYFTRNIMVSPSVTLPSGWRGATSLDVASKNGNRITFRQVSYEALVDSPMFAGLHYRREPLAADVALNIFADRPQDLEATPEQIAAHRELVEQFGKLYGAKHYDEYEFLVALTDELGGIGLEHLRSSENSHPRGYFTDWAKYSAGRDLLAHEMNHSWNGKYRRGADLFTPDYRTPMRNSLLWVYEGQTQFWGYILSARSGMMPVEDVKAELARTAAYYDIQPGRSWRPLIDTTNDPIVNARRPQAFGSWQRSEDYYSEGMLIWLDVDSRIRSLTNGRRSLDHFARAFFGVRPNDQGIFPYTFEDVVRTLGEIAPYDWNSYLTQRVEKVGEAPLGWIGRGGYRLVYRDTPTPYFAGREKDREMLDLTYTIGATIGKGGIVTGVAWDSPLFNQGVTGGTQIVAINGQEYSDNDFKAAITAAKGGRTPIEMLVKKGDRYRTIDLDYYDGLRYPVLERVGSGPSTLDALLAPL
ncbi:peptidase M61 [Sphingosinicella sp. GR2756]|uniref:Peptidase M61 n=1 Tax=Sphingosinicella rhizophila TaxID=3050082 RepID=A0ABU3QD65_9SPHN|nr:peptidase M61 [Sphingosinicella sp. GR2756]MDT9600910.1 peptidase M61 [Sphingosinicella sp. GR2756]